MSYKLIAIDLDGTLLDDDKKLDKENIEVLSILKSKGMEIVIATGRRYWSARSFVKVLGFPITILANNGISAWSTEGDKRIFSRHIDPDKFYNLAKMGEKHGLYPIVHIDNFEEGYDFLLHHHPSKGYYKNYILDSDERYMVCSSFEEYKNPKPLVICYMGDYDVLDSMLKKIEEDMGNYITAHILTNAVKAGPILEIMPKGDSKWQGIMDYGASLGVKREEVVALGDDTNDVPMLRNAGLGIAMNNGTTLAKGSARVVSRHSNNEGGVGKTLRELLL